MTVTRVVLRQILCPTDFSEFSARALRHAMALARHFEARLTVLHVIPTPLAFGGELPYYPTGPLADSMSFRKHAEANLREFVEPARLKPVPVELSVREGIPWREIGSVAEDIAADLLVIGTHGASGFERFLLGSVTDKVLRSVACPVMTVCHEEGRTWEAPGLISRILCATDLSASSARTISFALSLAAESQARVTLLHVVNNAPSLDARRGDDLVETAGRLLRNAVPADARAWCQIDERVEIGKAYDKILQVAAEERSDLIVIGCPEHGALGSLLSGSTSQHVIRAATCPVLIARPPRHAAGVRATRSAEPSAERAVEPRG